jgi:hypothetical protein
MNELATKSDLVAAIKVQTLALTLYFGFMMTVGIVILALMKIL